MTLAEEWGQAGSKLFKKDLKISHNYWRISLLSVPGNILALVLPEILQTIIDPQLMEAQCGSRKGRGTVDQLWVV